MDKAPVSYRWHLPFSRIKNSYLIPEENVVTTMQTNDFIFSRIKLSSKNMLAHISLNKLISLLDRCYGGENQELKLQALL